MKVIIIADDLTGALDAAVQFSKKGIPALVTVNRDIAWADVPSEIEVVSINAETRHLSAKDAYAVVHRIARRVFRAGETCVYKKVDSSLRGNIGAEIAAVMDAIGCPTFCFAPAFPQNGRTTQDGKQFCYGKEIHRTEYAEDPYEPVLTNRIEEIIHRQTSEPVVCVPADGYAQALATVADEPTIYSFDASTQADLDRLAGEAVKSGRCCAYGGSAGLAASLSSRLAFHREAIPAPKRGAASLYLIGSVNQVALNQIAHATRLGYPVVYLTAEQQLRGDLFGRPEGDALTDEIAAHLEKANVCVVCTLKSRRHMAETAAYAKSLRLDPKAVSSRIVENIGLLTRQLLTKTRIGSLVVFGGDTLLGVMNSIGCRELMPVDEVEPGIVVSLIAGQNLLVVSKAGGFGTTEVIPRIEQYLRQV